MSATNIPSSLTSGITLSYNPEPRAQTSSYIVSPGTYMGFIPYNDDTEYRTLIMTGTISVSNNVTVSMYNPGPYINAQTMSFDAILKDTFIGCKSCKYTGKIENLDCSCKMKNTQLNSSVHYRGYGNVNDL